jgi:fumarylacetoacetase
MDYELELGVYVGRGNEQGSPIPIGEAERHVFGISLLNDWSARDIQGWEYQPLGPFLSKSFATTVSPWIVTLEALAPYRTQLSRPAEDPPLLAYLDSAETRERGAFDIRLEVLITTRRMEERGEPAHRLGLTSYRHAYWTIAQIVAHHTVNGCALVPGDLLGTGTLSGPHLEEAGAPRGAHAGREEPGEASRWRDAHVPRGRRRRDLPRLVRGAGRRAHRPGRGHCAATGGFAGVTVERAAGRSAPASRSS